MVMSNYSLHHTHVLEVLTVAMIVLDVIFIYDSSVSGVFVSVLWSDPLIFKQITRE
jgi:hypothetical protein